ncbi:MAG: DUF3618 domain-containing protein [Chloroflexota bacterium]
MGQGADLGRSDSYPLSGGETGAQDLGPVTESNSTPSPDGDDEVAAQRAQVEQTRDEMSGTIDAIQQKLSPGNLVQGAKESVREATIGRVEGVLNTATDKVEQAEEAATDMGGSIIDTIKQNPIPAALAGIGLGWLIAEARSQSSGSQSNRTTYQGYAYRNSRRGYGRGYEYGQGPYAEGGYTADYLGGSGTQSDGSGAGDAVNQVQNTLGQAANQVQQTVGQTVNQAQQTVGQTMNQAQEQVQQVGSSFSAMVEERPLAMAAGALTLGLAVGLAIPETPRENELMGEARETVMQKAESAAQDTMQKVEKVAEQAVGTAQESAKKQGLT